MPGGRTPRATNCVPLGLTHLNSAPSTSTVNVARSAKAFQSVPTAASYSAVPEMMDSTVTLIGSAVAALPDDP